jgi:hypothetical protein
VYEIAGWEYTFGSCLTLGVECGCDDRIEVDR